MASLSDRLDFVIGKRSAGPLEEHFGIRTVGDLLRYFPRKYSDGMTVRTEGEAFDPEDGEHVTFVDVITDTTSGRNRISIWGVVCPLMPRLMYGLPGKNWP